MNYISIQRVLDDIYDNDLLKNVPAERVVNRAQKLIKIVGVPTEFEEAVETVKIENYRGVLPKELNEVLGVKYKGAGIRYTTDTFHLSENKTGTDPTYKLQGRFIFTNFKQGEIEVAYNKLKVDEMGFPMIPDNESFISALELDVTIKEYEKRVAKGLMNMNVLLDMRKEYAWAVGQAQSSMQEFTPDKAESMSGILNQLIPRRREFTNGFANLGRREYNKRH